MTNEMKFLRKMTALLGLVTFVGTSAVYADSQCKGLSKGSCDSNSSCTWVDGYKRQDGTSVDAYCRAKPGQGETQKDKPAKNDKDKKKKEKPGKDDQDKTNDKPAKDDKDKKKKDKPGKDDQDKKKDKPAKEDKDKKKKDKDEKKKDKPAKGDKDKKKNKDK